MTELKLTCWECDAEYNTKSSDCNDIINTRRSYHQCRDAFINTIALCV